MVQLSKRFRFAACLLCLPASFALSSGPVVISKSPTPQMMTATVSPEIVITLDSPVDPTTVNARSVSVFGRWTGICPGEYSIEENGSRIRFVPSKSFSAGEWIGVAVSREILGANGEPMPQGVAWNFWTASEHGSLNLEEIQRINVRQKGSDTLIRTYGAYAGDLNGDGFHDFTVPNEDADDIRVFLNDGAGGYRNFTIFNLPARSRPSTNEGADFNRDGLLDFAVGNILGGTASVFIGDGLGSFEPAVTYTTSRETRGLGVIDIDGDGAADIVTANRGGNNISILHNNGNGTFAQARNMDAGGSGETSIAVADANNDGIMDVFVGHFNSRDLAVLLGDGDGGLARSTRVNCQGDAWMIAAGDVDNDGNVDVVTANARQDEYAVLLGDGNGGLGTAKTYSTGNFPLAIDLGDLDGDGDLDLVTSNFFSADFWVFENDGSGRFVSPRRLAAESAGSCAVLHDRDRDGDLDITGIDELDDLLFLFDNPGISSAVSTSDQNDSAPFTFELGQSYPNPLAASRSIHNGASSATLTIPFNLDQAQQVRLEILNLMGEAVASVLNQNLPAGRHKASAGIQDLPAGIYFYRLTGAIRSETRRFVIIR